MQFADPRTDFAFKLIFGNDKAREVLISFLNAVLGLDGIHAIAEVTILNPYQAPKISTLKRSYLDVKMQDDRGIAIAARKEGRQDVARAMRQKGYDLGVIAEVTGFTLDELERM